MTSMANCCDGERLVSDVRVVHSAGWTNVAEPLCCDRKFRTPASRELPVALAECDGGDGVGAQVVDVGPVIEE